MSSPHGCREQVPFTVEAVRWTLVDPGGFLAAPRPPELHATAQVPDAPPRSLSRALRRYNNNSVASDLIALGELGRRPGTVA